MVFSSISGPLSGQQQRLLLTVGAVSESGLLTGLMMAVSVSEPADCTSLITWIPLQILSGGLEVGSCIPCNGMWTCLLRLLQQRQRNLQDECSRPRGNGARMQYEEGTHASGTWSVVGAEAAETFSRQRSPITNEQET